MKQLERRPLKKNNALYVYKHNLEENILIKQTNEKDLHFMY